MPQLSTTQKEALISITKHSPQVWFWHDIEPHLQSAITAMNDFETLPQTATRFLNQYRDTMSLNEYSTTPNLL